MRQQSVINLSPIDTAKRKGFIGRFLVTVWSGGEKPVKMQPFGHYMFCGSQGNGKTSSALWYAERLTKKYRKSGYRVRLYSNIGLGNQIVKRDLYTTINELKPSDKEIRIFIIDEIQTYYTRDALTTKQDKEDIKNMNAVFSQLRKRSTFVLSTSQVYGRVDKTLREQVLYMVNCKVSKLTGKFINEFIHGDKILVDELGRWSGDPTRIYVHGLPKSDYDTKKIIKE